LDARTKEMLGLAASMFCAATTASTITSCRRAPRRLRSGAARGLQRLARRRRIDCDPAPAPRDRDARSPAPRAGRGPADRTLTAPRGPVRSPRRAAVLLSSAPPPGGASNPPVSGFASGTVNERSITLWRLWNCAGGSVGRSRRRRSASCTARGRRCTSSCSLAASSPGAEPRRRGGLRTLVALAAVLGRRWLHDLQFHGAAARGRAHAVFRDAAPTGRRRRSVALRVSQRNLPPAVHALAPRPPRAARRWRSGP